MKTLGNIIWVLFGGAVTAIEYVISSIGMMVTIVGIPFGLQTLKLAELALWPFDKKIRTIPSSSGCLSTIMNVIWFFIGGLPIALTHLLFGVLFYITIIGIPFGNQHFKLMRLAFAPFGKEAVRAE